MKAVLLAAGRGVRLHPYTQDTPKPLVRVGENTCLDIALEALAGTCSQVVIVVGFLSEKIIRHLEENPPNVPYKIALNPNPEKGNLTSLKAARSEVEGSAFIIANADHLLPANFYTDFFPADETISVAGENNRTIIEDEMKIIERDCRLEQISKTLPSYDGAYIGVTRVPLACSQIYWQAFDKVLQTQDPQIACVENVLQELAGGGGAPKVHWIEGLKWFEVDTEEDLMIAREGLK